MTDPAILRALAYLGIAVVSLLPLILALRALRHLRNIERSLSYLELAERCRNSNRSERK